ncbi:hypothetical protein C8J57DRAFT_234006 [Mycena rebaudengoi]|nr:hypothetical protein C8J57DRAFT_234006 [Mycena rebaudengoi]
MVLPGSYLWMFLALTSLALQATCTRCSSPPTRRCTLFYRERSLFDVDTFCASPHCSLTGAAQNWLDLALTTARNIIQIMDGYTSSCCCVPAFCPIVRPQVGAAVPAFWLLCDPLSNIESFDECLANG